jgi:hypothetical protein
VSATIDSATSPMTSAARSRGREAVDGARPLSLSVVLTADRET